MKIVGTGLSGLVGSYVVRFLSPSFTFENLSLDTGVDITNRQDIEQHIASSSASWVFHFAAKTNVDEAEQEKDLGEESPTWKVNVEGTRNVVEACRKFRKKLLYLSTDFVFPGGKNVFTEKHKPNPIGWYATTKYIGEQEARTLGKNALIVRIAFPYGAIHGPRLDFVQRMIRVLQEGKTLFAPVDQVFVPTHLQTIAEGIRLLVKRNAFGVYHVVGPSAISSYEAAQSIAKVFGYPLSLVQKTIAEEFYKGRAPRAFQLLISNAKITKLGLQAISFEEGITMMRKEGI